MATIPVNYEQRGSVSLASGSTSTNVTIFADADHSILFTSVSGGNNQIGQSKVMFDWSNPTSMAIRKKTTGAAVTANYAIIEFDSTANAQHFTRSGVTNGDTQAITRVDLSRSIIISTGSQNTGGSYSSDDEAKLSFVEDGVTGESVSVLINITATAANKDIAFSIIEFPANAIASIQTLDFSSSAASVDQTITSVDKSKTLLFATSTVSDSLQSRYIYNTELTSNTNVNFSMNTGGVITHDIHMFVVEFADYSVIHDKAAVAGLTQTDTFPSTPSNPVALINNVVETSWTGSADADDDSADAQFSVAFSGDTATFTRAASTVTSNLSWSMIDWGQLAAGNTMSVNGLLLSSTLDNTALSQSAPIVVNDALSSTAIDNTALIQSSVISAGGLDLSAALDPVTLSGSSTISVNGMLLSTSLESTQLSQASLLAIQDLLSSSSLGNITLDSGAILSVAGVNLTSTLDVSSFTQAHVLSISELSSNILLDNITLVTELLSDINSRTIVVIADARNAVIVEDDRNTITIEDSRLLILLD